jgi:hypothetical protein
MRRAFYLALACALTLQVALTQKKAAITKQAERGRELFQNSTKGLPCATCHSMGGLGTAVGPDLKVLASVAIPRGLVSAIQMQMTENVYDVKTASESFPGIMKQKQADQMDVFDLSKTPPVLRSLPSKDVVSMTRDDKWKHPPTSAGYTAQELADIIGFLRWAATGDTKEVKVDDIE